MKTKIVKCFIAFVFLFVLNNITSAFAQSFNGIDPGVQQATQQYLGLYTGDSQKGLNWANILAMLIFGAVGFIAFTYGKKNGSFKPMTIGIVLMIYPYVITNTIAMYAVGIGLSALLYFWRD